jgi:hypothetical protein
VESPILSPNDAHELAEFKALLAVRAEWRRRLREGLSLEYDYRSVHDRVYQDSIDAYARTKTVEASGTETPEA